MLKTSNQTLDTTLTFARFVKYAALLIGLAAFINIPIFTFIFSAPDFAWVKWEMAAVVIISIVTAVLAHREQSAWGAVFISITITCTTLLNIQPDDFLSRPNSAILILPITVMGFVFGKRVALALAIAVIASMSILPILIPGAAWSEYTFANVSLICTSVGLLWVIHHLFAQLRLTNVQLRETNEREQRARAFMYFFQHELNSYAVSLKTTMQYFQQTFASVPMDEQTRNILALTSNSVEKLKKLAHELVILSREGILPHQWQEKNLSSLFEQARTESEVAYHQQSIPITIEAPPDLVVRVEPAYLLLALGTALRNAREVLAQESQAYEHPRISLSATVDDQRVIIRVEDNGPGFPAHILSAIQHAATPGSPLLLFGWSTKPAGLGLGLVLIIQVAQLHGGQATFGNNATGAYVTFDVPLASAIEAPASMATLATSG